MKELIARRYVKAIMQSLDESELKLFCRDLACVCALFNIEKFKTIIESPNITKEQKIQFVLSPIEKLDEKLQNLIKLLAEKDRLLIIPIIQKELDKQISQKENIYEGEILSSWEIDKEQIQKLEEGFSKRFSATVKLNEVKSNYPGIKITLEGLGVEASFSVERLKTQMTEHILKAI